MVKIFIFLFLSLVSYSLPIYAQNKIDVKVNQKSSQEMIEEPERSVLKITFYNKDNGKISQYPTQVFINNIQFTRDTLAVYEQKLFPGKYVFKFLLLGNTEILRKKIKVKKEFNYEVKITQEFKQRS